MIFSEQQSDRWQTVLSRRGGLLLLVLIALLLIGFYTISDPERLANSNVLTLGDYAGYAICHRITERSFTIAGRQFPLCARCTGMYLGVTLVFMALLLSGRSHWTELPPLRILLVLIFFVALLGVDGLNSYSHFFPNAPHLYQPQNWLRLLTGIGTGLGMGLVIFPALAQTLWRDQIGRPSVESFRELAPLILLALISVTLILSNQPTISYVMAIASAIGVVTIMSSLNTIILLIILKRDGYATTYWQIAWPLTIGFILTVIQIAIIATLRFQFTHTLTGFPGL